MLGRFAVAVVAAAVLPAGVPGSVSASADEAAAARARNLGLAAFGFAVDRNRVAFTVSEAGQGRRDLNGDGDLNDAVLHVHDGATGITVRVGFAVGGSPAAPNWTAIGRRSRSLSLDRSTI